jgi:hypothetical protein
MGQLRRVFSTERVVLLVCIDVILIDLVPYVYYGPYAVINHLRFCMAATTITWIYGAHLQKARRRRYATAKRTEYAFADLRWALAKDLGVEGFGIDCQILGNATRNLRIATVMDLAA